MTVGLGSFMSRLRHAFAIPDGPPLDADDIALLTRLADVVVQRRLAAPANLILESVGPLNFLGSQALHALTPLLDLAVPAADVQRLARLLERRDTLAYLARLIEQRALAESPR